MPIKFPRMHIARSVVNQIMDAHDEITARRRMEQAATLQDRAPVVTEPGPEGDAITATLASQQVGDMPEMGEPGSDSAAAASSILEGRSALDGLISKRGGA